jgi:cobalt-zinc-cadmium efflux system membrane fusion protein
MTRSAKLLSIGAAALLAVLVGYREFLAPRALNKVDKGDMHSGRKGSANKDGHGHDQGGKREGLVKLSAAQMRAAGIETAPVANGTLLKEIIVPARITINADRQSKIVPRLPGVVVKVGKRLGEVVAEGEVLAVLESREMADGKAEYLAARRAEELAKSVLDRQQLLWKDKIIAERELIASRHAHQSAEIKLDLAHQRLHTMGLSEAEIDALPSSADETRFRFYEIRSPIGGRVTARNLLLGQVVTIDKEIFTVAELSTVWIEMAVAPSDLTLAKEGQEVRVHSGAREASGKVVALSPVIDPDTRSAKAIAEIGNASGEWNLGDFVEARLMAGELAVNLMVPRGAVQTIKGARVVFVSITGGFVARPVTIGREDARNVEILSGLEFGEPVAVKNAFTLKAELGRAEAEHEH